MSGPSEASAPGRQRGRPRDLNARAAILSAAHALLDEEGTAGLTMEAVASRAGVGKPTVYRWFENRHAVAMAALMEVSPESKKHRLGSRTPSAMLALELQLFSLVDTLASRHGRNITTLIAAADPNTEIAKAFRHYVVLSRRAEGRLFLQAAIDEKELRMNFDIDTALDQIYGALFFRLLMGHAPLDKGFVRRLLAQAIEGLA